MILEVRVDRDKLVGSPEKWGSENAGLTSEEEKIYSVLAFKPRHIDEIVEDVHVSASQISSILTKLKI